jgi:hypothetical protein
VTARDQGGQRLALGLGQGARRGTEGLGAVGEHRGIHGVGLGQAPGRLGAVAHLRGSDHRQWQTGERQGRDYQPFQAAGGLQHQQRRIQRAQPLDQRGNADRIIRAAPVLAARAQRHVQRRFAYGDPREEGCGGAVGRLHLLCPPAIPAVPALHDPGFNAQTPVRVSAGAWRDDPGALTVWQTQGGAASRATRSEQRPSPRYKGGYFWYYQK